MSKSRSSDRPNENRMTPSAPLVSVVIPTHNRCGYITETITSVLSQDYPAVEIVVVDDGSSDATPDVLKSFGARINVVTQPPSGQVAAVNRGLAAATGDYITLVSDDDPILPGALSRLVDVLESNLHALAAYPDYFIIGPTGENIARVTVFEYSLVDMIRHHLCYPSACALFRRRALELTGGWDTRWRWVADYEFWLRVGLHGPMVHVAEPLATIRRHPTAATLAAPRLAFATEQVAVVESFLARPDLPPEVRAVENEAMVAAWAVAVGIIVDELELSGIPRFRIEDRFAAYIEHPIPIARTRDASALDEARRSVAELTHLLELSTNDRSSLLRRVEVLQRRIALREGSPIEDTLDV